MNIKERMKDIIAKEAAAIKAIKVTDAFEDAVNLLLHCRGKVITTGMGKAGYIANKFAATMSSTGTSAFFVHPAEAGHGDLGMLSEDDCIVAFSTSGKSNEVLEMLASLMRSTKQKTIKDFENYLNQVYKQNHPDGDPTGYRDS